MAKKNSQNKNGLAKQASIYAGAILAATGAVTSTADGSSSFDKYSKGAATPQPTAKTVYAKPAYAEPTVASVEGFIQNFKTAFNAEEEAMSKDQNVRKAAEIVMSMDPSDQIRFLNNPDEFVRMNPWFATFGVTPGSYLQNGYKSVAVGVIAKMIRSNLLERMQPAAEGAYGD